MATEDVPLSRIFLDRKFPKCSIIRPTETDGAVVALKALTSSINTDTRGPRRKLRPRGTRHR